jgi:uncharacterized protein YeaO (DUF488 family)
MNIQIKRAYEASSNSDGARYLVDQVWPRGKKREDLDLRGWLKVVAPSTALREWFHHDPARWDEFCSRYFKELDANSLALQPLLEAARKETITLVYGAKDTEHNQAVALKQYLESKL